MPKIDFEIVSLPPLKLDRRAESFAGYGVETRKLALELPVRLRR